MVIAAFIAGGILGGFVVWLVLRERLAAHRLALGEVEQLRSSSAKVFQQTAGSFLDLAKDKIEGVATSELRPIKESLQLFDRKVEELERARQRERGALAQQIQALQQGAEQLRGETAALVTALRASEGRAAAEANPRARRDAGAVRFRRAADLSGRRRLAEARRDRPAARRQEHRRRLEGSAEGAARRPAGGRRRDAEPPPGRVRPARPRAHAPAGREGVLAAV